MDGFVAHVAAFRSIDVVDIRPLKTRAANIHFLQFNVSELSPSRFGVADSVSCLHALEHFGLGRYGDPIAADGHEQGWKAIASIVEPGGWVYLPVPIGQRQRVEFNGHRVFSVPVLLKLVGSGFSVGALHYVDDHGELHTDVPSDGPEAKSSFGLRFGRKSTLVPPRLGLRAGFLD